MSDALDHVLRSLRGGDRRQVGGLHAQWHEVVGDQVAANVRPVRLDDGVLIVEVDEPAWATQVTFLATTIAERLTERIGTSVERVEVRVAGARRRM